MRRRGPPRTRRGATARWKQSAYSTAVATLFAQATLVRFTRDHRAQDRAWTIALAMFALASAALATGVSTGWDNGTFRVFYLFGAVLCVPWLGLGTVYLLAGATVGRRVELVLILFSTPLFRAASLMSADLVFASSFVAVFVLLTAVWSTGCRGRAVLASGRLAARWARSCRCRSAFASRHTRHRQP